MKGERPGFLKSVIEPAGTLGKTNQHVPVTHETRFASIPTRAHQGAWHRVHARLRMKRDLLAFRLGLTKVPGTGYMLGYARNEIC